MRCKSKNRWTVYYDGECALCLHLVRWFVLADIFRQIEWKPYQCLTALPKGLTWKGLSEACYLDVGHDTLREGFDAIKLILVKLPLLWPLMVLMWVPGVQIPGRWVYRWVARNRGSISRVITKNRD